MDGLHSLRRAGDFQAKDSGVCARHHPDSSELSMTQPPTAPRHTESRTNDAQQPRAPQHFPLQTAFGMTQCASAQVKSKPWASQ